MPAPLTAAVFHELIDELRALEGRLFLPDVPLDELSVLEGYKWIFTILAVGLDAHVWADSARPRFVDIVGPYRKWGGDNADAFYQYAPIDPDRTYVVTGRKGDADYLSLTVYGGPSDGRYSERIVGTVNDRALDIAADGTFSIVLSPHPHDGAWIAAGARCRVRHHPRLPGRSRQRAPRPVAHRVARPPAYPTRERRRSRPALPCRARRGFATRRRSSRSLWGHPTPSTSPTVCRARPSAGPRATPPTPWAPTSSARTRRSLSKAGPRPAPSGTSCLWNQFLHTYDYAYERVTINGDQAVYEPDGSWRLVVARRDPGHPNWISTAGHERGRIWFRWFLPEVDAVAARRHSVVRVDDARRFAAFMSVPGVSTSS